VGTRPQLDCRDVKRLLKLLGFQQIPTHRGSHEKFSAFARGRTRHVTVDCPKAPFSRDMVHSMSSQAGLTRDEFYAAASGIVPKNWP